MTISDKLTNIINAKSDIKDAINEKGVEVTTQTPLVDYANKIRSITGGASEFSELLGSPYDNANLKEALDNKTQVIIRRW